LIPSAFRLGLKNGKAQIVPHIGRLKEPEARSGFFEWKQFQTLLKFLLSP
jgi:hypothetical protein